jgi:hypothetical protein
MLPAVVLMMVARHRMVQIAVHARMITLASHMMIVLGMKTVDDRTIALVMMTVTAGARIGITLAAKMIVADMSTPSTKTAVWIVVTLVPTVIAVTSARVAVMMGIVAVVVPLLHMLIQHVRFAKFTATLHVIVGGAMKMTMMMKIEATRMQTLPPMVLIQIGTLTLVPPIISLEN